MIIGHKEGHKSFECPEVNGEKSQNKSGTFIFKLISFSYINFVISGGGCFRCGKDGHKSFECTETKRKMGGREQSCKISGNDRNSKIKWQIIILAGGCFNCGKDGHKSFECPEPKKGRPSTNGNSRNSGGFKRSFNGNHENGHSNGETNRKKIKFNDDDD